MPQPAAIAAAEPEEKQEPVPDLLMPAGQHAAEAGTAFLHHQSRF